MRLDASFRASLEAMTASYAISLHEAGWEVAAYLKKRGIDKGTAESYRLGMVNDKWPEHEPYQGMLCIPYRTRLGGVVSLKFRRPHDCTEHCQHSKYVGPYPTRLYNTVALDEGDREGYICVVEGEINAISLDTCGFPAVGIPGVDAWTAHPEWPGILAGYPRVCMFRDPDEPGARLSRAVVKDLGTSVVQVFNLGCDVNEYLQQYGKEEFCERISERLQSR